ncbi:MAG TPA: DUF1579 family protein [Gemmataceae bacterium]|nr:DUF1579 family protein [Gemmataceae bacterium]
MISRWLTTTAALLIVGPFALAQDKPPGSPTETHARMARRAGEYETVSKLTLPDGKGIESKGSAKLTAVLGGRFLQEESEGSLAGTPVSGLKFFGYNADAGLFEAVWMYTGSTAMMTMTGTMNEEKKSVEFSATVPGPREKKMNFTVVYRFPDADHFVVDLTARGEDGSKGPTLETTYTRKK